MAALILLQLWTTRTNPDTKNRTAFTVRQTPALATIVTGIGFLGAGAIFRTGNLVKGLTTAAGIFATAAVGMAVGSGLYVIGIFATVCILLVHFIMHKVQLGRDKAVFCKLTIKVNENDNRLGTVREFAKQNNVELEEQELIKDEPKEGARVISLIVCRFCKHLTLTHTRFFEKKCYFCRLKHCFNATRI